MMKTEKTAVCDFRRLTVDVFVLITYDGRIRFISGINPIFISEPYLHVSKTICYGLGQFIEGISPFRDATHTHQRKQELVHRLRVRHNCKTQVIALLELVVFREFPGVIRCHSEGEAAEVYIALIFGFLGSVEDGPYILWGIQRAHSIHHIANLAECWNGNRQHGDCHQTPPKTIVPLGGNGLFLIQGRLCLFHRGCPSRHYPLRKP